MPTTETDGATIHYEIAGMDGAPWLVFSNSLGTDLSMWNAQVAALGDRFRILRYDSRGHGKSSVPAGAYTIDRLGRDALAVMDAAGVETASFCGLSKGGMVGMWLGVHAPRRIERLALCNTAAHMPPPSMWDQRIEAANTQGMEALADGVIERWFTPDFRSRAPEAVDRVRDMLLTTSGAGYAGCCAAIRDMDQREAIPTIRAPTLVIAGIHDPATPPDKAEEIAGAVSGSKLVSLEAAHLSNIEKEADFTRTLAAFVSH